MAEPYKVLIADDHAMFRQGLRAFLEDSDALMVVGEAANGIEAVEKARELSPDVVVLDIQMPLCDGLQAAQTIKQDSPQTRVVILSGNGNDSEMMYRAIKAGAIGFMSKTCEIEDLIQAVKLAAEGQASFNTSSLMSLIDFIRRADGVPREKAEPIESLSEREQEVLHLVAQGLSNREISRSLYISESTVHSHLHNILGKLNLSSRVQAALLFWKKETPSVTPLGHQKWGPGK